uniref:Uncharacterized protein n=1 Tax=Anguilla anguilla TaxID=7936 RepID=A0A0E9XL08_ANGAN
MLDRTLCANAGNAKAATTKAVFKK